MRLIVRRPLVELARKVYQLLFYDAIGRTLTGGAKPALSNRFKSVWYSHNRLNREILQTVERYLPRTACKTQSIIHSDVASRPWRPQMRRSVISRAAL